MLYLYVVSTFDIYDRGVRVFQINISYLIVSLGLTCFFLRGRFHSKKLSRNDGQVPTNDVSGDNRMNNRWIMKISTSIDNDRWTINKRVLWTCGSHNMRNEVTTDRRRGRKRKRKCAIAVWWIDVSAVYTIYTSTWSTWQFYNSVCVCVCL